MLLARAGLKVLVLDRGREGTDTLSTHALMRGGVLQLHHWGILDALRAHSTPFVRSTSFHYGDEVLAIPLKPRDGIEGLCAPRRYLLDRLLVDAARTSGAEILFGVVVTDVVRSDAGRIVGVVAKSIDDAGTVEVSAGLVIGADGMRSAMAKHVGAEAYRTARHTTAVVFGYFAGLDLDGYHWYYRPGVSVGAIPTNGGTCIFTAFPPARFSELSADLAAGHLQVLRECNAELAEHVARAERTEPLRGFAGLHGYVRQSWGPGWALVGDAAYFKDPLTAHGMTDALIDAEHLAHAVAAGTDRALEDYQRARDERALTFFEATDAIASFEWDLPALQVLHRTLSEEMKREAAEVLALHAAP
jgi:menaquinone-9 beta-reductase